MLYPNQRLTYEEKTKDDLTWAKHMIDYLAKHAHNQTKQYTTMMANYRLYNNILNQKDFERDCNVLGIDVGQAPENVLPYNKTYNKIQVLLSDELRRPYRYTVILQDPDSIKKKEVAKTNMLKDWVASELKMYSIEYEQKKLEQLKAQLAKQQQQQQSQQQTQQVTGEQDPNQMQAQEQDMQAQQQAIQEQEEQLKLIEQEAKAYMDSLVPPHEIEKWHQTKYRESREIASANIMAHLERTLQIKEKKNDAFKHGLISGMEFVYVGANDTGIELNVLNSPYVFYHKSPETKYVQDGLYAGYKMYLTYSDVIAKFGSILSKENYEKLDKKMNGWNMSSLAGGYGSEMKYPYNNMSEQYDLNFDFGIEHSDYGQYDQKRENQLLVTHAEWVSQRKVFALTFKNEYGDEEIKFADESFKIPKDAEKRKKDNDLNNKDKYCYYFNIGETEYKVEELWIPQVWEGVKIANDIYCNIGPKKYSFFSSYMPHKHKLGYHGVVYSNTNAEPISLMERMRPYQMLYFAIWHKVRKLVAQDRGKLIHFDTTMIPEKMDLKDVIYYMDELNIDFYNPLKNAELPGGYNRGKISTSTDRSNMGHIMNYIELLNFLDGQISDAAGITRQREGQTTPSQAVTNAQSDIAQSSLVTEMYFSIHNNVWEDVLNSLMSISRKWYKDNNIRNLQLILDDLSVQTIQMSEDDLEECDMGLFVADSLKENFVLDSLKQLSQALIQNDKANLSHVISMLESNSLAELKREIKVFEKEQADSAQQEQQHQMQMQRDAQEYARETMMMREQAITEREIKKEEIAVFKFQKDLDGNDNGVPDPLEIERLKMERDYNAEQLILEDKKLTLKEKELKNKKEIEEFKVRNKPKPKK